MSALRRIITAREKHNEIDMAFNDTDDPLELKLVKTATECQQNFYEICADWNLYEKDQHCYLKSFIGYALYGPPELKQQDDNVEGANTTRKNNNGHHEQSCYVYDDEKEKSICLIYDKVMEYGKSEESKGIVLCGIIYNVIFNKEESIKAAARKKASESKNSDDGEASGNNSNKNVETPSNDENEKSLEITSNLEPQVYPVPVFKIRQHVNEKMERDIEMSKKKGESTTSSSSEKNKKTYYIDNVARVYDGFDDYLENNRLPRCTMVLPKDGRYQMNPVACPKENFPKENKENIDNVVVTKVWIEIHQSPASNLAKKILTGGDVASTIVTVASMGVGIAALLTPVGAGVALAGAVGAGVSGLWQAGRCAQQLADRGQHGESINVTNKEALGAWIGVAGGTMGLAATGGGVLLARAVRTGTTVGRAATVAYDVVLIGNLVVNGVGVGFKGYDMVATYINGGDITAQDIFFLTTHIFFFCNAVINIRLTQSFVENSQGQLLKDYEASLRSNRHRKEFQRMARNTRAAGSSDVASNEEIIRSINKINNKDEFFQAMVRNRKTFSASGAKAAFSSDGKITVNSIMTIDPIEFANLPQDARVEIVKGVSSVQFNNSAPSIKQPSSSINNETSYKNFTANSSAILKEFCLKHSNAMIKTAPPNIAHFANVLGDLRKVQSAGEIFVKLLDIGYKILQALPRDRQFKLGDILSIIVQFLWDYIKMNLRYFRPGMILEDPSANILLERLLQELLLRVEKNIDLWVEAFKEWLEKKFPHAINLLFVNTPHSLHT